MGKKSGIKFYTVWKGRNPGVYHTWEECRQQISQFPGAKYKSFSSLNMAEIAFEEGWEKYYSKSNEKENLFPSETILDLIEKSDIEKNSYACDASCIKNPGPVEYRTVSLSNGNIVIHKKINFGTNNLGEFLGIVHSLAHFKKNNIKTVLYCDSGVAIGWVKKKRIVSKLARDSRSKEIWQLTTRALYWLKQNSYKTILKKWDTKNWGEIPADFGRK